MQNEFPKEIWAEICFILSQSINSNVSENIYEQTVLRAIEKLGWRQFRREIEIQPSLQIGRQSSIRPDLVIYGPARKALIVIEVKRPAEDMTKDNAIGQLKSYMRQMKADFGLLVGMELRIFYDGNLNPQPEPLLLEKIVFDRNSSAGRKFVEIFYKDNFLNEQYIPYLKETIGQFNKEREITKLKKTLRSEETKDKVIEFLKTEYTDFGQDIVEAAMEKLKIDLSYDLDSGEDDPSSDIILICKNKASGENFIFIEDVGIGKARLVTPKGEIKTLTISLFNDPDEMEKDYLLDHNFVTPIQVERYHNFVKEGGEITPPVNGRREPGRKGYEKLEHYLLPAIKLMNRGHKHTAAFRNIANKLDVRYQTVSAQCTLRIGIDTEQFVSLVKRGEIVQLLKTKFRDRTELIEQELKR